MLNFFISLIGYFIIFVAADINRKECCKIKIFSFYWFLQVFLVLIGVTIIFYFSNI